MAMRSLKSGAVLAVVALGVLQAAGCGDAASACARDPALACGPFAATTGSGGTAGSASTGTGQRPGVECAGDPTQDATLVRKECGVFVQADAANVTETGTPTQPYKTLQKALDNAGAKRIYVCSSAPYEEAVTIDGPMEVYGGFACTKGWAWTATGRSVLTAPPGSIPLTLTTRADGAKVRGFAITAASAAVPGGSSIAVAVDDIAATLESCAVTAGDGAAGEDGAQAGIATRGADAPTTAMLVMDACLPYAPYLVGGAPGVTLCADGTTTAGGMGGKGGLPGVMSGDGASGAAGPEAESGEGGDGQTASQECLPGLDGKHGKDGAAGAAGLLPGAPALTGLRDTNTTDGKPGTRGYGGGGGGAGKAALCPNAVIGNGPSGGGGGAGGCGGRGGGGGKAGGSSLAIVSLGTRLTLTDVALTTGRGGPGGRGALGEYRGAGGAGASGGAPSGVFAPKPGCSGGNGGVGGFGGPGGGGRGGHSVGLAYATAPSTAPALPTFFHGDLPGDGGAATDLNPTAFGATGAAGPCWDFATNASCAQ
jgi:hypothetical protein